MPKGIPVDADKFENCYDLISAFRIMAYKWYPYLSSYVYSLRAVERPGLGTMAVDKSARMYFDPAFCYQQTYESGAYVVLHETFHLALDHCARLADIVGENPSAQDLEDSNIAADIVVWEAMESMAEYMPEGGVTWYEAKKLFPKIQRNMTYQEYFEVIKQHRLDNPPKPKPKDQPGSRDVEVGNPGGNEKEEPTEEKTEPTGSQEKPVDAPFKRVGGGSSADGQPREYEEEPDDKWESFIKAEVTDKMDKEVQAFEGNPNKSCLAGPHVPESLKVALEKALRPAPDPWKHLGAAVGRAVSTPVGYPEMTYRRPSRRQQCTDCKLKSATPVSPNVVVVLDTSGSMCYGETQAQALSVIAKGLSTVKQFPVVAGDTVARSSKLVQNLGQVTWDGGGGTDMRLVLEAAHKKYKPSVMVLVTDGYTPWPDNRQPYRLVVACTTNAECPSWAVTCRIPNTN